MTSARYRPVHHNSYMKTYALLEEMGLPLAFHAGYNWNDQTVGMMNRFISVHALGFVFYNMVHLANWIINGLPERFPKLKVLWIESGLAWVPFMMQRFDNEYMMRSSEAPALKKLPSDYMRDMFFSSQPMEMTDMAALENNLPHDQGGNPVALFVRLSALGLRPALDDLRPAVPERAGQAQYSRRQCDARVQSQAAGAKAGERRVTGRRYQRRNIVRILLVFASVLMLHASGASAQDAAANYPNRPIRIIVCVPAGGGVDTVTRIVANGLQKKLGQPVVVENRAGAGGNIGAEAVFSADPDGYTLLAAQPSPLTVNPLLYSKIAFDPAKFEPVAIMTTVRQCAAGAAGLSRPRPRRNSSPMPRPIPARSIMPRRASAPPRI